MLVLPIKQKWFDMILHGGKTEEYREIKPYWDKRIIKALGYTAEEEKKAKQQLRNKEISKEIHICFRNGYGKHAPMFYTDCTVSIGIGRQKWGAEQDKEY